MKKHEILSPQSRAALFDPPTDPAAIVRHYTLSPDDLALIHQRQRDANRLGFATHFAYLKFPGRVLGSAEVPSCDMVAFLASQLGIESDAYSEYHSVTKPVGSILATYNRICEFVLSAATITAVLQGSLRPKQLAPIEAM